MFHDSKINGEPSKSVYITFPGFLWHVYKYNVNVADPFYSNFNSDIKHCANSDPDHPNRGQ